MAIKPCTLTAKTRAIPSSHRDSNVAKEIRREPVLSSGNTTSPYCRAVSNHNLCHNRNSNPHSMKISERSLCLLIVLVITIGCQKKETQIKQISISVNNNTEDYSSLIKSYEVIPLDNNPEAYFRFSQDVLLSENIWLFCNPNDAKIVVLDNKGKFLNTIGKRDVDPGKSTMSMISTMIQRIIP